MPFRRKKRKGRRYKRRSYRNKYQSRGANMVASARTGSLTCLQKQLDNSIVIPAGPLPNGFVTKMSFEVEDLSQFTTFSSLFDQYRLNGIKVQLLPTSNTNDTLNAGGIFVSSIDLDSDTTITTFEDILQCSNARTSSWSTAGGMTPWKTMYLKPRAQNLLNSGNVDPVSGNPIFTTSLLPRGKWIDMGDRGKTKHYGLNLGWEINSGGGLNSTQQIAAIVTYYLQFRKIR